VAVKVALKKPPARKMVSPAVRPVKKSASSALRAGGTAAVSAPPLEPAGVLIGEITHYFSKIMVCVVKVTDKSLLVGDKILISGSSTNFHQRVKSLQIQSVDVQMARRGDLVGLKTDEVCRVGDKVYKI